MKIENYPVVKLLIPYILGILIAYYRDMGASVRPVVLLLTGVSFLATFLLTFTKAYRWRILKTTVMGTAFVLTGILLTDIRLHPTLPTVLMENNTDWVVRVAEEPSPRKKSAETWLADMDDKQLAEIFRLDTTIV